MPSLAGSNKPLVSTLPVASSSITSEGGTRPPLPITMGAGRGLRDESTVVVGDVISVVMRFVLDEPPGRNSLTRPLAVTESATATAAGAVAVTTKIASEVASSVSGFGSCR